MPERDDRIEPIFDDQQSRGERHDNGLPSFDVEPVEPETRHIIRVVAAVVVATCLFFVGDRLYTRYQEHQAIKAFQQELEALGIGMSDTLQQAGASLDQINRAAIARAATAAKQQQERLEQQRRQRLDTTEGYWLSKNCSDWTQAWTELKAETAEQEMKKHCARLERYLETGIAPPGTPRAGNRTP